MTPGDIIYHRRVRVLDLAAETDVAKACRVFGVPARRSIAGRRSGRVRAGGVDAQAATSTAAAQRDADVGGRGAVGRGGGAPHVGRGSLRRVPRGEGLCHQPQRSPEAVEPFGVGPTPQPRRRPCPADRRDHGPGTEPALEGPFGFGHFAARPGDLVALDSFFIGKLKGVGPVWQLTVVDTVTRWAICEVFIGPSHADTTAAFLDRVIRKLRRLGVTVTGVLSDNGPEFTGTAFTRHITGLGLRHHRTPPRSPNHNADAKLPRHRAPRMLASRVPRRRFDRLTQLRAEIDSWLVTYNTRRPNRSDFMRGRTPRQVLDSTVTSSSMTIIHTVHLSPRPVARKG